MLMAHPAVLRNLLEQYETLDAVHAHAGAPEARQRLEDVTYTLCVATGTLNIEDALIAARQQLQDHLGHLQSDSPTAS
ncbi:DUF5133 domain-containing protein [Streptomyces sp. 8N706]|uniref:DUF5133 domain-containing protein n=1 Tax=Streptomyces sp. 8N706 TaxID=3457416 RepID=UPI003FD68F98